MIRAIPPLNHAISVNAERNAIQALDESIAKIDACLAQDKKVCLFVGRTPREKLPSDTGEAKPDELWVSGDISDNGPATSPDRIHLCFDFNNQELIKKVQKRFDLIVVDFSVTKFLDGDFANRFSVMLRTSQSKLIFEASTHTRQAIEDLSEPIFSTQSYEVTYPFDLADAFYRKKQRHFEEYQANTAAAQIEVDRKAFMQRVGNVILSDLAELPKEEQEREIEEQFMHFVAEKAGIEDETIVLEAFAINQLKAHLEKTFAQVDLIEGRPYPFRNYSTETNCPHFIVSRHKGE